VWPSQLEQLIAEGKREGVFTQASFAVGTLEEMWTGGETETWFDLASVTKVVGTTSSIISLVGDGKLAFDMPWREVLPETPQDFDGVTVRDVMRHRAGYRAHRRLDLIYPNPGAAWAGLLAEKPFIEPHKETHYSCLGFLLLGMVVARSSGMAYSNFTMKVLNEFIGEGEFQFGLPKDQRVHAAPTECLADGTCIQGTVHDENAAFLAPEAGNAGLFSRASAMGKFGQLVLRTVLGLEDHPRMRAAVLQEAIFGPSEGRSLGYDRKAAMDASVGDLWGSRSFGHLGFTGTSFWVEPDRRIFAVLLTNRVHTTRDNPKIHDFRRRFHTEVFKNIP
jgi:CubicO group peptidase (beta-lactamase class C family)